MADVSIVGIDPGAIHTGCVGLRFATVQRTVDVIFKVIEGVDVAEVRDWLDTHRGPTFIEDYNPGNYGQEDKRMTEALGRLKAEFPPSDDPIVRYVDNAGINTLVPLAVQQIFKIDKFPVTTHHNDLRSAGKIALLGMIQDKSETLMLRRLVSLVVEDELAGRGWVVRQHA